jgi:spoIIIJ-associated protein
MEWVETTGKTLEDAKGAALDQLGVADDEAEFEVLEEPKSGLFGRVRGEARVRARVMPAAVRPKQERRNRGRAKPKGGSDRSQAKSGAGKEIAPDQDNKPANSRGNSKNGSGAGSRDRPQKSSNNRKSGGNKSNSNKERTVSDERPESNVTPQEVGDAAVEFMQGLAGPLSDTAQASLAIDGTDLEVSVDGGELGLLIGPGGRTLSAVQDLARVASQRRLGDHDTRLRVDVSGYRVKRRAALEEFAGSIAAQVLETGDAKAMEPMSSADRKSVHDAIVEIDGVVSRSDGDDPNRRVVISPG